MCLVLEETAKPSSQAAVPFHISTEDKQEFPWLRILASNWCGQTLDLCHSDECAVVSPAVHPFTVL